MERIRSGEWYLPGGDEPNAASSSPSGAGAMVMPGVTVGDTLVAGVPATVKRSLLDAPPAPTD